MGRETVPTKILEMRGAYKNHPERAKDRENEPKPTAPLGNPPRSLNKQQKAIWRELVKPVPDGVLTAMDRAHLELACILLARIRNGDANSADQGQLIKCLTEIGMTPASRSKVSVPKKEKANKWDD